MIVRGNPGLGIPSSYDPPQTEEIGYANREITSVPLSVGL
jgi:hypothetical protein